MMLLSLALFLPAAAAGFGLAQVLWDNPRPSALALKAFLGIGLGLGVTSCLYFFSLFLVPTQAAWIPIQLVLLAAVIAVLLLRRGLRFQPPSRIGPPTALYLVLGLAVIAALLFAGQYSLTKARLSPHGDYDAQAIWNLRARFIHRLGADWRGAFSPDINRDFHMDYPLLVPLNVVGGWSTLGREELRLPAAQAMLFTLAAAGALLSALAHLRTFAHGTLALILLLATPAFLAVSTFQTADIPLAFFFLGALSLLVIASNEGSRGALFLAGLAAALSAWTKNEGQPFLLICAASALVLAPRGRKLRWLGAFLVGAALPLAALIFFRLAIPSASDLLADRGLASLLARLTDPARLSLILGYLLPALANLGEWPVSLIAVLAVFGLLMGREKGSPAERWSWSLPLLQIIGYLLVYLLTPNDLEWQLKYSIDRLLLQVLPMLLLAYFLAVRLHFNVPKVPVPK